MIVVDTSALLAILEDESDAPDFARAIAEADPPLISAASIVELGIVMMNRHGSRALSKVNKLMKEADFQVESVSVEQARLAIEAYANFGKGRKNKAGLNYGDCFTYALAKATGLPLLYKGHDFSETDLTPVL